MLNLLDIGLDYHFSLHINETEVFEYFSRQIFTANYLFFLINFRFVMHLKEFVFSRSVAE